MISEVIRHQIFHLQKEGGDGDREREMWEKKNEKGERRKWKAKRVA